MEKTLKEIVLLLLVFVSFGACTAVYTARGVYYRAQKGDTLAGIAEKFHAKLQEVAEINNIERAEDLKTGRSIFIPRVTPPGFARIIRRETRKSRRFAKREEKGIKKERRGKGEGRGKRVATGPVPAGIEVDHDRFRWPVDGGLSSLFGIRRGRRHDGIDIRAREGTPVLVAASGEVVFSKRMRGYGNLVLVKHEDDFFTVYAHNSVNLVKAGRRVKKGDIISKVGRTGRASGPHLHFEVREGTQPRNPLFFLPKTAVAKKAQEKGANYGGPEREGKGEVEVEDP